MSLACISSPFQFVSLSPSANGSGDVCVIERERERVYLVYSQILILDDLSNPLIGI